MLRCLSTCHAFLLFAFILTYPRQTIAAIDEAPRRATAQEVRDLFDRLTMPVPLRLRIQAEAEFIEQAWTDEQILKEVIRQERIMEKADQRLSENERKGLRDARFNAIRNSHSGKKHMKNQEWLSGKLYRLDQTDLSTLLSDLDLAAKIKNKEIQYHMTFVNIGDSGFTNVSGFRANHSLMSATMNTSRQKPLELWQALTIEPKAAIGFLITLVDTNSISVGSTNHVDTSFAGWKIDPEKLGAMVEQRMPGWIVTVREVMLGSNRTKCLLMQTPPKSPDQAQFEFYSDYDNPHRLYKIHAQRSNAPAYFTSVRGDFDTNGFPRQWRTESQDEKGRHTTRIVTFNEVDLNPDFDDRDVFGVRFPTNYIVADITPSGKQIIQNPDPRSKVINTSAKLQARRSIIAVIIMLLVLAPMLFIMRKRHNSKA